MRHANTLGPPREATVILIAGLAISHYLAGLGTSPSEVARSAAIGTVTSLGLSFLVDMRRMPANLVRADVMALCALYFLTLFEFLLPQPHFDVLVRIEEVAPAIDACLVAFAGIALGRHFLMPAPASLLQTLRRDFPARALLTLFWIAIIAGFFYQWLAVDFNVFDWFDAMMAPRFTQPWTRGRFGDWKALLGEIGMIINLAPPIAGIILARRRQYTSSAVWSVTAALLLTFFYGFTSGTRNVLVTFVTTFSVAYAFTLDRTKKRELFTVMTFSVAALLTATVAMLNFRTIGFSNYLKGERNPVIEDDRTTLFVDYNLYVIAKLVGVFPDRHPYLGFEIPYLSIIRPIPRAIWSGKPEGMSLGIEDALGVEGLTLASSFVGESYMSGGLLGVLLTGFVFGSITGWWNRFGDPNNSPFGHLVFASGFFASVISMRSMFVFTTAILPTIGALLLGNWLLARYSAGRRRPPPHADA
jgi:hypothetical protein